MDDDDMDDLDEYLMLQDDVENEIAKEAELESSQNLLAEPPPDEIDADINHVSSWSRPDLKPLNADEDAILFQQMDIDHYLGAFWEGTSSDKPCCPKSCREQGPIVRLFGVTADEHSVCAHVHGFRPYFFIPAPAGFDSGSHLRLFTSKLNEAVLADLRGNKEGLSSAVVKIEVHELESIYGYTGSGKQPFLKIFMAKPKLTPNGIRISRI